MQVDLKYSVSIIVPLLNGADYLPSILSAINKQTLKPSEVIFVISRSGDWKIAKGLIEEEKNFSTKVLISDPIFPGAARNFGASEALSEWLAFLDIRTIPTKDWLEIMMKTLHQESADLVSSKMVCSTDTFFQKILKASTYGNNAVECLPGSIVQKDLFISSGGFLDYVRAGEDWEWMNRFSLHNKSVKQQNIVIRYHGLPNNIFQLIKKWFVYSFENSKVNILLKEKFSYMGLAFIIFSILLYRWNHIVSGGVWNENALLFIPNLNKIFWSAFLFLYLIYRGLYKPISDKVVTTFLLPFLWILVGTLGLIIDLVKAPGRVYGSVMYLASRFKK